jgi:hypothetical protein
LLHPAESLCLLVTKVPFAAIFPELQSRPSRRRQAIETLHQTEASYRSTIELYAAACREFDRVLNSIPAAVIYEHDATKTKLLDLLHELRTYQASLAEGTLRTTAARNLVAMFSPETGGHYRNVSRQNLLANAALLVDQEIARNESKLHTLHELRDNLVNATNTLVHRAHAATRLRLLNNDSAALVELEAFIDNRWPGAVSHSRASEDVWITATHRAVELAKKFGVVNAFRAILTRVYREMQHELPSVLRKKMRELLAKAARDLSIDLDTWCQNQTPFAGSPVARAILALHFTFSAARQGLGGVSTTDQARYERELDAASPVQIQAAIELLLDRDLLTTSDEELFGYTPSVRRPFRDCVRSRFATRDVRR